MRVRNRVYTLIDNAWYDQALQCAMYWKRRLWNIIVFLIMVIKRISARNYQLVMDPSTARYIMDYLYFARDVEPVWYYKKVSSPHNDRKRDVKLIFISVYEQVTPIQYLSKCSVVWTLHHKCWKWNREYECYWASSIVIFTIKTLFVLKTVCDLERKYSVHKPYVCFEVVMNFGLKF